MIAGTSDTENIYEADTPSAVIMARVRTSVLVFSRKNKNGSADTSVVNVVTDKTFIRRRSAMYTKPKRILLPFSVSPSLFLPPPLP